MLSPTGYAPDGWHGVSYPTFIDALKQKIAVNFVEQSFSKWLLFLREFTLHLDGLMSTPKVPDQTMDYVLENLSNIQAIQEQTNEVVKAIQLECLSYLQTALELDIETKLHHWYGYPAIKFSFPTWSSGSDVVLFLDSRDNKSFCINYYACGLLDDQNRLNAIKALKTKDCIEDWYESSKTVCGFKASLPSFDKETIYSVVLEKLKLMDHFEIRVRAIE